MRVLGFLLALLAGWPAHAADFDSPGSSGENTTAFHKHYFGAPAGPVCILKDAATIVLDANKCQGYVVTLGGNRTLKGPYGLLRSEPQTFDFIQDATGTRIPTFPSNFQFPGGVTPTLSTSPGSEDILPCAGSLSKSGVVVCGNLLSAVAPIPPIAVDGTATAPGGATGTTTTLTLSTTKPNDVIAIGTLSNTSSTTTVSSISSTNTTGWTQRAGVNPNGGATCCILALWIGKAAAPLTNEVITITYSSASIFSSASAAAFSGINFTTPSDPNGALPATTNVNHGTVSITTSHANDALIGTCYMNGTATPTAGAGWTEVTAGSSFIAYQYQIVSVTQSSTLVALGGGATDQQACIGDALQSQ